MEYLHFHKVVPFSEIPDRELEYSVVAARHRNQWLCVRLKERSDWCFPGGGREDGETIEENARRELFEETGATSFDIHPLGVYGVDHRQSEEINSGIDGRIRISWGGLYAAEIHSFGPIPEEFEIAERKGFDEFPVNNARFPHIMPGMMKWLEENLTI